MAANVALGLGALAVAIAGLRMLGEVTAMTWAALTALAAGAVTLGHLNGGPLPSTRRVLAAFCALRFPALALALGTLSQEPERITPIVLAYVVVSAVAVTVYLGIARRRGHAPPAYGVPAR